MTLRWCGAQNVSARSQASADEPVPESFALDWGIHALVSVHSLQLSGYSYHRVSFRWMQEDLHDAVLKGNPTNPGPFLLGCAWVIVSQGVGPVRSLSPQQQHSYHGCNIILNANRQSFVQWKYVVSTNHRVSESDSDRLRCWSGARPLLRWGLLYPLQRSCWSDAVGITYTCAYVYTAPGWKYIYIYTVSPP